MATDLRLHDRTIPVRVRYPDAQRFDPSGWQTRPSAARTASSCRRRSLVTIADGHGRSGADAREPPADGPGQRRAWRIATSAAPSTRSSRMLASMQLPVGYTWEVGGQYHVAAAAFRELLLVFGIATALVFVILVVQFRGFTAAADHPRGGAALARRRAALLLLTGTDLNVSSAMGLILLVGLVVKNGIVLLDFAEMRLRGRRCRSHDAMLAAARRPAAADPDDDAVHAVRPAAAGAGPGRRRGAAEAAGARGDRRSQPLDAGHAVPRAGG